MRPLAHQMFGRLVRLVFSGRPGWLDFKGVLPVYQGRRLPDHREIALMQRAIGTLRVYALEMARAARPRQRCPAVGRGLREVGAGRGERATLATDACDHQRGLAVHL